MTEEARGARAKSCRFGLVQTGVVEVEVQYFEGCPRWEAACQRLRAALVEVGHSGHPVTLRKIDSAEDAERMRFRGSPSIVVDGVDLFEDPSLSVGMACRIYAGEAGLDGAPETAALVAALRHRLRTSSTGST